MSTPQSSFSERRMPLTERNTPNENEWLYSVEKSIIERRTELENIRDDSRKELSEKLLERRRRSPGYHLTPGATRTPKEERSQKTEELVVSVASSGAGKRFDPSPLSSEPRGRQHSANTYSRMSNAGAHTTPMSKPLAFEERVNLDALEQEKEKLQSEVEQRTIDLRKAQDELNKRDRVVEQLHALQMDRDRECHDLKEDVKKKVDQMRVVEDKLGEVMSERDHLSSLHRDWELRMRELQADQQKQYEALTASEEDRAVLARSLNDRNDQLEALQRRINETEHEKKQLQDRVRHSEREMASLRDEITRQSCDTTRHTDQDIFIRDERIAALERELEDQRRRASGMETEARQLSALRDQLDAARSLNEERQQEKDQVINTLHAEIERLQQLNEGHAVMSAQIVRLQHDLSTRGQELSELRAELEQGMRERKDLVALEQQRSHRVTELQARLAAIKKEQEEVISDYNARLQHEIAVREDSERKLREQLEEAKRAVLQVPELPTAGEAAGLVETIRAQAGSLPLAVVQEREAMMSELARYKCQVEALEDSIKERDAILAEKEAQLLEHEEQRAIAEGVIVKVKNYACRILNQRSHHIIRRQIMRVGFSGLWRSRIAHLGNEIERVHAQVQEKDRIIGDLEGRLQDLRAELAEQMRKPEMIMASPGAAPQLLPRRPVRGVNKSASVSLGLCKVLLAVVVAALATLQLAFSLGRNTFCSQDGVRLAM